MPEPLRVRIESRSGSVRVEAVEGGGLEASGGAIKSDPDGTVVVRGGSKKLDVRVPAGSDVSIGTISGSVDLKGSVGSARVTSKSGSIDIEDARSVDARTASGTVRVTSCREECRVVVVSGSVLIGHAGTASLSCVSGTIRAAEVDAAEVKTVSGTTELGATATGRVQVRSVSGTVRIKVPSDRSPATRLRSISGRIQCDCEQGRDGEVDIKTVSGTIQVACN
jgi:DUF4097 and DUF4098 domain-containing protein YvlB